MEVEIAELVTLRAQLTLAEAKAHELAAAYGAAFALYNHQRDIVQHLTTAVKAAERKLLDSVK